MRIAKLEYYNIKSITYRPVRTGSALCVLLELVGSDCAPPCAVFPGVVAWQLAELPATRTRGA